MQSKHEDQQSHKSAGFAGMDDAQKVKKTRMRMKREMNIPTYPCNWEE